MNTDTPTDSFGKLVSTREVVFTRHLAAPPELVWEFLVDPEKRSRWFCGGEQATHVGGKMLFHFQHARLSGPGDIVPEKYAEMHANGAKMNTTVTAFDPPRLLGITWNDGEEPGASSEVIFTLEPSGQSTLLTLRHRKLPDKETLASVGAGWHTHLSILGAILEGSEPPLVWNTHTSLQKPYADLVGIDLSEVKSCS